MKRTIRTRLYLGRNIARTYEASAATEYTAATVSDRALREFLTRHVAWRWPGFTVIDSIGYWEGSPERCAIVEHIALDSEISVSVTTTAQTIADAYKAKFSQDAVLIVQDAITAELV